MSTTQMTKQEKVRYLMLLQERTKRQAETDLWTFFRHYAWPVLQPGTAFVDNWHIHVICEHLEAVSSGQIKKLCINLPFRLLKSTIVSQAFPAWEWIRRPHLQYLTASYAKDIATRDAVDSRKIIESAIYQEAWGDRFEMTSDQNVKQRFENDKKGSRVVTATDAAGTGFGGNRIIIDDPVSAKEADSESARAASIEWWKGTAATRLNNPKDDAIIVVHQRLNTEDLTGYIMKNEDGWDHLVLPMRYDPELAKTTSLGYHDPRKVKGELLHPARLDEATVSAMEKTLGSYHTAAQLQQSPTSRTGSVFKKSDWKFYHIRPEHLISQMDEIIWSWDCTFKDGAGTDYVAGHCIGRRGADKYLLARVNERMGFSATQRAVLSSSKRFKKTIAVLVEDKANGPAVIDTLKSSVSGLIPVNPQGGKLARANAVQPQHEAGNFWLPAPEVEFEWQNLANGVHSFIDLFASFPQVQHDDDVDAWTQGVNWFNTRQGYEEESPEPYVGGGRVYA